MKKAIIIIIVILVLGGGYYMYQKSGQGSLDKLSKEMESQGEKMNLYSWLTGGKGVECTVLDPEGKITIKAEKGKVRVDGINYVSPSQEEGTQESGTSLTVDNMVYIWSGNKGMKMDLDKMKEMGASEDEDDAVEQYSWEDMTSDWEEEELGYECREEKFSDKIFTPPTDVEFEDFTETMEKLKEMSDKMLENVEGNMDMEGLQKELEKFQDMNQEDIEEKLENMGADTKTMLNIEE